MARFDSILDTIGNTPLVKLRELAETHGYYLCRQFENEANAAVHTATTAREILEDFAGETPHYFVSGAGTGGTLKGVARGRTLYSVSCLSPCPTC
jgi:cysteine synthase A